MATKVQFLTLDIISEIAFGNAFGNLESDEDISSYMKTVQDMFPLIILLGTWPVLAKVFFWKPFRRFLPKETDTTGVGKLMGFVLPLFNTPCLETNVYLSLIRIGKQAVAERFGPNKKVKHDMIGSLLAHGLTQREAQTETLLQMYLPTHLITHSHITSHPH